MSRGRPPISVSLAAGDRAVLDSWLRASKTRRSLAERARIMIGFDEGLSAEEIAVRERVHVRTVHKWRKRYEAEGIEGLNDLSRSGQPTKLKPQKAQEILTLTVKRIPHEATHWSTRLMAKYTGVSPYLVSKVWAAADLKPHRLQSFKISNDPRFAEKVVDVVGLYLAPPDNAMVLSVDEKTQVQALERTQPMLPLERGKPQTRTHDYKRHGTASLYAAFDVATGNVIGRVTELHRAKEFLAFLGQIDRQTSKELDLHLILDNSSTHKTAEVQDWLTKHPRFHLHFTPTSASWLNAVEGWFAQLERRSIYRGSFSSVKALRDEIKRFVSVHNERLAKPFVWTKSAEAILEKVEEAKRRRHSATN